MNNVVQDSPILDSSLDISNSDSFAFDSLESLRKRLLDLTARNRLLNYRFTKTGQIRIIDELPDQLAELLISEKRLTFKPVPEPTLHELKQHGYIGKDEHTGKQKNLKPDPDAVAWAKVLGFDTSYELPDEVDSTESKHNDTEIQTLMFPPELETRLKGIRTKAVTAIEETGSNFLYIAFGFLEWYENNDSGNKRLAPLYLIPVSLEKGKLDPETKRYLYYLSYTGEDILPNLSLKEKLRVDFGLGLPDLDEDTTPEAFFAELQSIIETPQPKWKVRRQCALTLLEFGNLLMYLDLDPANWPKGSKNITEHSIVSRFFSSTGSAEEGAGAFAEEYLVDEIDHVHNLYPLIDDADSSQHSAVVDAINGKNLVIEGPPGTGKSQTITNIIAAAIAQGKSVLFVAEKLAALEVVKRRLDKAGLGDFCLELHSHKTQKRKLLDDIAQRLTNQSEYESPRQIEANIERYESLKSKLNGYAELVNSEWKNTGLTIHEILNRSVRYRSAELTALDLRPNGISGDTFTASLFRECIDNIKLYRDVYERVLEQLGSSKGINNHPWYGIENTTLQIFDAQNAVTKLNEWTDTLSSLATVIESANQQIVSDETITGITSSENFVESVNSLPDLQGNEYFPSLPKLTIDKINSVDEFIILTQKIQDTYGELSALVQSHFLDNLDECDELNAAYDSLTEFGVDKDILLTDIAKSHQNLEKLIERLVKISDPIKELSERLGNEFSSHINLSINGLNEFSKYLLVISKITPELLKYRDEVFDEDEIDDTLAALDQDLVVLREQFDKACSIVKVEKLPTSDELSEIKEALENGGLFKWFKSSWRNAKNNLLSYSSERNDDLNYLIRELPSLIKFKESYQNFLSNKQYIERLKEHFKGLDTPIEELKELRTWYKEIRTNYGIGFGPKAGLGSTLINMPLEVVKGVQSLFKQGIDEEIRAVLESTDKIRSILSNCNLLKDDKTLLLSEDSYDLSGVLSELATALEPIQKAALGETKTPSDFKVLLNQIDFLRDDIRKWHSNSYLSDLFDNQISLKIGRLEKVNNSLEAIRNTLAFANHIQMPGVSPQVFSALMNSPSTDTISGLQTTSLSIERACKVARLKELHFSELVTLNSSLWYPNESDKIYELIDRNNFAASQPDWLSTWVDFVRFRQVVEKLGFRNLLARIEEGEVKIEDVEGSLHYGIYDLLSREVFAEHPELAQYSGQVQSAIQAQFRDYDESLKSLQQKKIAYLSSRKTPPSGNSGGRVSSYSELSLLRHEIGKKKRHIPIRQMINRAGKALSTLKPCFMMGPKSVAQYLPAGQLEFDLVIIDEASQVKPQDALGAIARGRQFVVVGDPKQLPPTSFFDKLSDDDDDDDISGIQQSESVLGAAVPLFPMRRLRWHYRSQHEGLIAFSNQSFYDSNLVVFPSPNSSSADYGIKFHRIHRGRFINQRNIEEARVIAQSVAEHLNNRPDESLGVVAMSANQREQIDRAIEELAKTDPSVQEALEANQEKNESLFIKNLENVQGDERDVIYISCTYGPHDAEGKLMYQRFGPINSDVGWRRLNVLFTRSKKRMHIFSSMDPDHIHVTESSSRGVKAFREFLGYAKTGHINQPQLTGRAPDSDFEVAVSRALNDHGFECVPQVGVAGFFIDLAVRDPGNPGAFLMGIECDGATYHSAKSARDRDRLRQTVLERLGWNIRRIWSTDWFKNPEAQIRPIIDALNKLRTEIPESQDINEVTEIDEIVVLEDSQDTSTDEAIKGCITLKGKLMDFDHKIIRVQSTNVPDEKRILRPAMLEALLHSRPMDMHEFQEHIAAYLRTDTDSSEGRYLPEILRIIAEDEA